MKVLSILKKFIIESIRDWKILIFTLVFGPLFVSIFYVAFNDKETTYKVGVYNKDIAVIDKNGTKVNVGKTLLDKLENEKNSDGSPKYKLTVEKDLDKAKKNVRQQKYDIYIVFPENFSKSVLEQNDDYSISNTKLFAYGDISSQKYIISAIMINEDANKLINNTIGRKTTLQFVEEFVVTYKDRTEFEAAIPAAIFIGIIMILFTSAIALIKEVDSGTIRRIQISKASALEVLAALNISQIIIGIAEIALTLVMAFGVYKAKPGGSIGAILFVGILACISVIPIGFIVASFSRTVSDILIYGNIPYALMFIFSGAFPLPRLNILSIAGHAVAINDLLPTTSAMTALKMIMDEGAKLSNVSFQIGLTIFMTIIYYIIGLILFNKKHMKLS